MTSVTASAPGKIVIAGEYAVLRGAPAVAMAVNRRAVATVADSADDYSSVATSGYADGDYRFRMSGDGVDWLDGGEARDRLALVERVLEETAFVAAQPVAIQIDSGAFTDSSSGRKLGLGSSAAVAVALAAACLEAGGRKGPTSACAARAHRAYQQGRGSGVDIATSAHGGVIAYRRDGSVTALQWPAGLHAAILWSGQPSSTADRISGLEDGSASPVETALATAAAEAATAWARADTGEVLRVLADFVLRLIDFDARFGRGIFDAGHARLVDMAGADPHLVYKPCGAGGGDVGMAFADSRTALDAFVERATDEGFRRLRTGLDEDGVRLETEALFA